MNRKDHVSRCVHVDLDYDCDGPVSDSATGTVAAVVAVILLSWSVALKLVFRKENILEK